MAITEIHKLSLESAVRSYHVYMSIWNPAVGDVLIYKEESGSDSELATDTFILLFSLLSLDGFQ